MDEKRASQIDSFAENNTNTKKSVRPTVIMILAFVLLFCTIVSWILFSNLLKKSDDTKNVTENTLKEIPKLVIANQGEKSTIYPTSMDSDYAYAQNFQSFEGLVRYEDQSKIVPALATSWSNPDELTWRFNLKKNVKFHTGRTMTADDVVYSYEQAKKNDYLNDVFLNSITSVTAKSPSVVEVKTKDPDPVLLNKLNFMLIVDRQSEGKEASPIYGTGPYTLKPGTTPTKNKIELTAINNYHVGKVLTKELTFVTQSEDSEAQAFLEKKQANIAGDFVAKSIPALENKGFISRKITDTGVAFILPITTKAGPLQNGDVRRAVQAAIDVPAIIKAADLQASQATQFIPQAVPGYNDNIKPVKQDVGKAKELLVKAGYPNGVKLEMVHAPSFPVEMREALKSQLAQANIDLSLRETPSITATLDEVENKKTDMAVFSYSSDTFDGAEVLSNVLYGFGSYDSQETKQLLEKAAITVKPQDRLKLLKDAAQQISDNAAVFPLYLREKTWYMDKEYILPRDMPGADMGVYFWKAHLK